MLNPVKDATGRTVSRIKQHQGHGRLIGLDERNLDIFGGERCTFFNCTGCKWFGWLPIKEFVEL